MSERLIDERNRSLNPITDYLAALIRDGKIDAISINAEQMGDAIANLRCGEIRDVSTPEGKAYADGYADGFIAASKPVSNGQTVGISDIRAALECAERLADDKGSDLQYSIIAKGVLALRSIERESVSRDAVHRLFNEIDCRIEHGAESGGHLNYVHKELKAILNGIEGGKSDE